MISLLNLELGEVTENESNNTNIKYKMGIYIFINNLPTMVTQQRAAGREVATPAASKAAGRCLILGELITTLTWACISFPITW